MAGLAGLSTFDPTLVMAAGPFVALLVYLFGRPLSLKVTATVLLSFALACWVIASNMWTVNPLSTLSTLTWASLLIMFVFMLDFIQTRRQLRAVAIGYLAGAFTAVVRIMFENPDAIFSETVERSSLGDLNENYLGYAFAAGFALIVLLLATAPKRTIRTYVALGTTTVAILIGVELTGTRGAYLGLACVLLWLLAWKMFRLRSVRLVVIVFVTVAALIVTGIADQASLAFESGDRATGDWSGRLKLWPIARELWADNPVVGYGAGSFRVLGGYEISAHNFLLETGVNLGGIGVLLLLGIYWSSLRSGSRDVEPRQRALLIGSFLAASAPAYLTGVWELAPAAWIVLAIFARLNALTTPAFPEVIPGKRGSMSGIAS
ncbi:MULTISPECIES: O-antigen ligase family protein [unclassified Microbacterium]|uniref:O-antigen ligase family protein n=1 Tax=unclassified Microbacterium TaxID=2609290 RepID=UPI00109CB549|nr:MULTISPECIES: O-antigen ligase family protein [unclassified Microbacterium]